MRLPWLILILFATSAYPLEFMGEEPIPVPSSPAWPVNRVLRHLVFTTPEGIQFDVYKNEMAFSEGRRGHAQAQSLPFVELHNFGAYSRLINELITLVEKAEASRLWPPEILGRIRDLVLKRADTVDYITATRWDRGTPVTVGTVRRTASAQYNAPGTNLPIIPRTPLILESLFDTRLTLPHASVQRAAGPPIWGGELNEIGGYWVADGEDKDFISSRLLALLVFLIEDPRIPLDFQRQGRKWVMFTDKPGHRYFTHRYGFKPVSDSTAQFRRGTTQFFVDENDPALFRERLLAEFSCGEALALEVARTHLVTAPF